MTSHREPFTLRPAKPRPYWPVIVVALLVVMAVVLLIDDLRIGLAAQFSRVWPAQSLPARPTEQRRPDASPAASTAIPPPAPGAVFRCDRAGSVTYSHDPACGASAGKSVRIDPNVNIVRSTPVTRTLLPTIVETPLIAGAANIGPRQKVDSPQCQDIDRRVAELDVAAARPLSMAEQERIRADRRWLRNRQVSLGC